MKTLHLLRHAKSDGTEEGLADHERALAPRGERAAALMGRWLEQIDARPERLLCSSARRARETLEGLHPVWSARPEVSIVEDLYLASAARILELLRRMEAEVQGVLVLGHNPGLHDLACGLAARGDPALLAALSRGLPTAACCEIAFDIDGWAGLEPHDGTLIHFATPKELV